MAQASACGGRRASSTTWTSAQNGPRASSYIPSRAQRCGWARRPCAWRVHATAGDLGGACACRHAVSIISPIETEGDDRAWPAKQRASRCETPRNWWFLPNANFIVSSGLGSRVDVVSPVGNGFFYFSSLSSLTRLPCQHFCLVGKLFNRYRNHHQCLLGLP